VPLEEKINGQLSQPRADVKLRNRPQVCRFGDLEVAPSDLFLAKESLIFDSLSHFICSTYFKAQCKPETNAFPDTTQNNFRLQSGI
jgi:hypothetical protein